MTAPAERVVELFAIPARSGCADCGSYQTVQMSSYRGRVCSDHATIPTIPPGEYRREFALEIADLGRIHLALVYLAAHLARACDDRFDAAIEALR